MLPDCGASSDEEIVALALKQADYFACLVKRYEPLLRRYLARLTRLPNEEISDLLQDTFLQAYRNLNDFDPSLRFSSWIYRITHNVAISNFRKKKTRLGATLQDDSLLSLESTYLDEVSPDLEIANRETARIVNEIIIKMPQNYRDAFVLRFLENKTYDEISDILQKSAGTVATLIHRGRDYFKKEADAKGLSWSKGSHAFESVKPDGEKAQSWSRPVEEDEK